MVGDKSGDPNAVIGYQVGTIPPALGQWDKVVACKQVYPGYF